MSATAIADSLRLSSANGALFERSFTKALISDVSARSPLTNASDDVIGVTRFFNRFQETVSTLYLYRIRSL